MKKIIGILFLFVLLFFAFKFLKSTKQDETQTEESISQKKQEVVSDTTTTDVVINHQAETKLPSENTVDKSEAEEENKPSQKEAIIKNTNNKKNTSKEKYLLNPGKIVKKEGLDKKILIYQNFKYPSKTGEYISEVYDLNIKNPGFVSLSAYTLDMSDNIRLYYKYFDGKKWTGWIELPKDTHIVNHKRNVFGLVSINSDIDKIQFKSPVSPGSEVVFNFFIPNN